MDPYTRYLEERLRYVLSLMRLERFDISSVETQWQSPQTEIRGHRTERRANRNKEVKKPNALRFCCIAVNEGENTKKIILDKLNNMNLDVEIDDIDCFRSFAWNVGDLFYDAIVIFQNEEIRNAVLKKKDLIQRYTNIEVMENLCP